MFHCWEGDDGKYLNLAGSDVLTYQKVLEKVLHSKGRHKSSDGEEIQVIGKDDLRSQTMIFIHLGMSAVFLWLGDIMFKYTKEL